MNKISFLTSLVQYLTSLEHDISSLNPNSHNLDSQIKKLASQVSLLNMQLQIYQHMMIFKMGCLKFDIDFSLTTLELELHSSFPELTTEISSLNQMFQTDIEDLLGHLS